jgi:hypothetical protein
LSILSLIELIVTHALGDAGRSEVDNSTLIVARENVVSSKDTRNDSHVASGAVLVQKDKRQVSKAFAMSGYEPSGRAHNLFAGYEGWVS